MTDTPVVPRAHSYGCSMGCGNPYDFIVIDVRSSDTLFLCVPDFIRIASDMVAAMTMPDDPIVQAALDANPEQEQAPHTYEPLSMAGTPFENMPPITMCPDCGAPDDVPHASTCAFAV